MSDPMNDEDAKPWARIFSADEDNLYWMDGTVFTEEALRAQDGKEVPLTLETGGPVIGEATMKYDSGEKALMAEFIVDDPKMEELLNGALPLKFTKKES